MKIVVLMASLLLPACDAAHASPAVMAACLALGLCDETPEPPIAIDMLCDASAGSSCSRESLESTLDVALRHVADRPGSLLRLWTLGQDVGHTVVGGERVIPPVTSGSDRARRIQADRLVAGATDFFLAAASSALESEPIRRSPIAEAITKIAMADARGLPRQIIVVTDGREVSGVAGFECGLIPGEQAFLARLDRRGLLTAGSLQNAAVTLAFVQSAPVPGRGCPVRLDREIRIRALWTAALQRAGARQTSVLSGPPRFDDSAERAQTERTP